MAQPFVGEIRLFGGNFAPEGWATCDGQLLSIAEYSTLFSLIGTTYGGDGVTNFALPDLRGRVPLSQGQGPGLSPRALGNSFGTETVALSAAQAPHSHALIANNSGATASTPGGNLLAQIAPPNLLYSAAAASPAALNPASVSISGGGAGHPNMMATLCITFIIALNGIFPSQG